MTPTAAVRRPRFLHVLAAVAIVEITALTLAVALRNRRDQAAYNARALAKALSQADEPCPPVDPDDEASEAASEAFERLMRYLGAEQQQPQPVEPHVGPVPMPAYPGPAGYGHVAPMPAHPYLLHTNGDDTRIEGGTITSQSITAQPTPLRHLNAVTIHVADTAEDDARDARVMAAIRSARIDPARRR